MNIWIKKAKTCVDYLQYWTEILLLLLPHSDSHPTASRFLMIFFLRCASRLVRFTKVKFFFRRNQRSKRWKTHLVILSPNKFLLLITFGVEFFAFFSVVHFTRPFPTRFSDSALSSRVVVVLAGSHGIYLRLVGGKFRCCFGRDYLILQEYCFSMHENYSTNLPTHE